MFGASVFVRLLPVLVLLDRSSCRRSARSPFTLLERRYSKEHLVPELYLREPPHRVIVCVQVNLSIWPLQENETVQIHVSDSFKLLARKRNHTLLWSSSAENRTHVTNIKRPRKKTFWLLQYDCVPVPPGCRSNVSVYMQQELLVQADLLPHASVSVDHAARRFTLQIHTHQPLKINLCYDRSTSVCHQLQHLGKIDPALNRTLRLDFPSLVPCLCVQLWHLKVDARRNTLCPLREPALPGAGDVLSSSSLRVFPSELHWEPLCPADQSHPTVSLCWLLQAEPARCVPAPNTTLHGSKLKYNISAVDRHPQMCAEFALNNSRKVFCPFMSEESGWSVSVTPGSLHLSLRLTSSVSARVTAQLCEREGEGCKPRGPVVLRQLAGGAEEAELILPFSFLSSSLCVQVWRADLIGRRILCPDYTHRRWGLISGGSVALLAALVLLLCVSGYVLTSSATVWRHAQKRPLLMVCSSDDPAHLSAVCRLASGLQGELVVDVRLAEWALCGPQWSVAGVGPVPWLHGQCGAVRGAGGLVLIAWSPDAHQAFLRWRKSRKSTDDEKDEAPANIRDTASSNTMLDAAFSCLWARIDADGHAPGYGLVCFQSVGGNRIPEPLSRVQRFCLPGDTAALIRQLGQSRDGCWPRLLSSLMSRLVAQNLKARLQASDENMRKWRSLGRLKRKRPRRKRKFSPLLVSQNTLELRQDGH